MSHILGFASERTSVELGEAKRAETVNIFILSELPWLISGVQQASPDHHLRSNICHLQSIFTRVLRCLLDLGTFPRALRMLRSRCNVLSPRALCRAT